MQLFLLFLFSCFVGSIVVRKWDRRLNAWMLLGLCLAVCVGYFVFRQI